MTASLALAPLRSPPAYPTARLVGRWLIVAPRWAVGSSRALASRSGPVRLQIGDSAGVGKASRGK